MRLEHHLVGGYMRYISPHIIIIIIIIYFVFYRACFLNLKFFCFTLVYLIVLNLISCGVLWLSGLVHWTRVSGVARM